MKSSQSKYGRISQGFHWISTLIILMMWPLGLYMTRVATDDLQVRLYRLHVGLGLVVLVLTVARVIWRFLEPTPEMPTKLSLLQKRTIKLVRIITYLVLLLLTFSGVGILITNGVGFFPGSSVPAAINDGLPVSLHITAFRLTIVLLIMHIAGIVRYQLVHGDVMGRMGVNLSRS